MVEVEIRNNVLILRNLKGTNIKMEGFVRLLQSQFKEELKEAAKYQRICPARIYEMSGSSGRRSYNIQYVEDKCGYTISRKKELIYISCFDKIAYVEVFLPDLVLVLPNLLEEANNIVKDISLVEVKPIKNIDMANFHNYTTEETESIVDIFLTTQ